MSRTLKDLVLAAVMFLVMQFRWWMCSERAKVLCEGSKVLDAWVVFSQQPPKAKRGIGGRKILSLDFTESSSECYLTAQACVYFLLHSFVWPSCYTSVSFVLQKMGMLVQLVIL